MPASESMNSVISAASPGRRCAQAGEVLDALAVLAAVRERDDHGERAEVHEQVGQQVEEHRRAARLRCRRRSRSAGSPRARCSSRRAAASRSPGSRPSRCRPSIVAAASTQSTSRAASPSGPNAEREQRAADAANAATFTVTAHERGHRGGRALVDVGRPLVERTAEILNAKPTTTSARPSARERVARIEARPDRRESSGARGAVEQRHAVEQDRARERADQEVLERGLVAAQLAAVEAREHVDRDAHQLEAEEHREQVDRGRPAGSCPRVASRISA